MNKPDLFAAYTAVAAIFFVVNLSGENATVSWDASPDASVAGYKVYYAASGSTNRVLDAELVTSITLSNLSAGKTYTIFATAYNSQKVESQNSQVLSYTVLARDTDQDGLPDTFELTYGLNLSSAADATTDPDGDGFTNLEEYYAGTNPTNASSVLRITAVLPRDTGAAIQFASVADNVYSLEGNDSFPSGAWTPISNGIAGTGGIVEVVNSGWTPQTKRMYRVVTTSSTGVTIASDIAGNYPLT